MLVYNFERVFKARGIDKPFTFLCQSGLSDNFATKIKNNKATIIHNKQLERLCLILHCTPNDFLEWIPDANDPSDPKHPLNILRRSADTVELTKTLNAIPLGRVAEIEKIIKEELDK